MAEGKKSFIIYNDSRNMVNKLSDERAGILFKTIFSYCDDENPICEDEVIDIVFEHFKGILKRDLKKYEGIVERNRENGKKGGRPKNPVGNLATQTNQTQPKKADTDTDTDTDTETIIINEVRANEVFMKYRENYKTYATFIYKNEITRNSLRDTFFKLANTDEILALTLKHYLDLFLKHLDITKELHQTQKAFVNHFPNWLRKQKSLEIIKPKQQPKRYV
jgi:hypothetical protein